MVTNKKLNRLALALASSAAVFAAPSMAFDLTGKGFIQYGDAQSYSLPVLALQAGCTTPGCEFYVASSPGAIKGLTVLGTGASGQDLNTNFVGMEDAYETPSGVSGATFWRPSAATYTNVSTNGDSVNPLGRTATTWDSSLLALKTYLAGEAMIFFFNNNQVNSGGTALQSLAAWAQITVKNAAGTIIGTYDLTNRSTTASLGGSYLTGAEGGGGALLGSVGGYLSGGGGPVAGTNASTDYVLSGGALCLLGTDLVNCATPGASAPINHNLGANQAAYALLFPELNLQLAGLFGLSDATLASFTMSVDVRLGCDPGVAGGDTSVTCTGGPYGRNLNNGYEQIFISKASDVVNVPEPGTMMLLGLALLGLAGVRRRA